MPSGTFFLYLGDRRPRITSDLQPQTSHYARFSAAECEKNNCAKHSANLLLRIICRLSQRLLNNASPSLHGPNPVFCAANQPVLRELWGLMLQKKGVLDSKPPILHKPCPLWARRVTEGLGNLASLALPKQG